MHKKKIRTKQIPTRIIEGKSQRNVVMIIDKAVLFSREHIENCLCMGQTALESTVNAQVAKGNVDVNVALLL